MVFDQIGFVGKFARARPIAHVCYVTDIKRISCLFMKYARQIDLTKRNKLAVLFIKKLGMVRAIFASVRNNELKLLP